MIKTNASKPQQNFKTRKKRRLSNSMRIFPMKGQADALLDSGFLLWVNICHFLLSHSNNYIYLKIKKFSHTIAFIYTHSLWFETATNCKQKSEIHKFLKWIRLHQHENGNFCFLIFFFIIRSTPFLLGNIFLPKVVCLLDGNQRKWIKKAVDPKGGKNGDNVYYSFSFFKLIFFEVQYVLVRV